MFWIRRRKKLLQKQLALECGLDPSYVAALENGRRIPPRKPVVEKIIKALGATPVERDRLLASADISRLSRMIERQGKDVRGANLAIMLLELTYDLSEDELVALETFLNGLKARSAMSTREVSTMR